MFERMIESRLAAEEKRLGGSLDYARRILRQSPGAFRRFMMATPVTRYRKVLPPEAYHVARLVATIKEDCGTCVQMEINMARQAGVSSEILQATLERPEELPEELRQICRFTHTVLSGADDVELRQLLAKRLGEEAMIELALGIATCRIYPVTKRALGFAQSCRAVEFDFGE